LKTLKNHPFFKGIDWTNLSKNPAPKREVMPMPEMNPSKIEDFPSTNLLIGVSAVSIYPLITGAVLKKDAL